MTEPYILPKTITKSGAAPHPGLKTIGALLVPQNYAPKPPEAITVQQLLDKVQKLLADGLVKADAKVYLCCQDHLTDVDYSSEGNLDLC
jgi:hypothetical protein